MNASLLSSLLAAAIATPALLWSQDAPAPELAPAPARLVTSRLAPGSLPDWAFYIVDGQPLDGQDLEIASQGGTKNTLPSDSSSLLARRREQLAKLHDEQAVTQDELVKARRELEKAEQRLQKLQQRLKSRETAREKSHAQQSHDDLTSALRKKKQQQHENELTRRFLLHRNNVAKAEASSGRSRDIQGLVIKNQTDTKPTTIFTTKHRSEGLSGAANQSASPTTPRVARTITTTRSHAGQDSGVTVIVENGDVHIYHGSGTGSVDVHAAHKANGQHQHEAHAKGQRPRWDSEIETHSELGKDHKKHAIIQGIAGINGLKKLKALGDLDHSIFSEGKEALKALEDFEIDFEDFDFDIDLDFDLDSIGFDGDALEEALEEIEEEFEGAMEEFEEEIEDVMEELEEEFEAALEEIEEAAEEEESGECDEASSNEEITSDDSRGVANSAASKNWPAGPDFWGASPGFPSGQPTDFDLASNPQVDDALMLEIAGLLQELRDDVRGLRGDVSELAAELEHMPQAAPKGQATRPRRPSPPQRLPRRSLR